MLDQTKQEAWGQPLSGDTAVAPPIDLGETIRALFAAVWRQRYIMGSLTFLFVAAGFYYAMTATPQFTAAASVVIDPRISNPSTGAAAPTLFLADALVVDSEVEVLRSRDLSDRLVDRLGLLERDDEPEEPGLATQVVNAARTFAYSLFARDDGPAVVVNEETALLRKREQLRKEMAKGLEIYRSGDTYVIDITYTSPDPQYAAQVANALVDEYFLVQAEAAYANTRRVSEWLAERVSVMAERVAEADARVDQYREENQLFSMVGETLPSSLELTRANEELIALRSELVDLTAVLARLREAREANAININLTEEQRTAALTDLQARFNDLSALVSEREAELGSSHNLTRQAREDRARIRALIVDEYGNVIERLESRRDLLELQVENSADRLSELRSATSEDAQKSIRLRELEGEASAKRRLYESLLQQFNEVTQQETFEVSPARVIATAVPPDKKSAPDRKLILALAAFAGVVLGGGLGFLREALDNSFRSPSEVEDELGLDVIGLAPLISDDQRKLKSKGWRPPTPARRARGRRGLTRAGLNLRFAADNPPSLYAETLRALDARLINLSNEGDRCPVIGFTSVHRGEGKTTLSGNFAVMKAALGYRVALLDLDIRASTLAQGVRQVPSPNALSKLLSDKDALGNVQPIETLSDVVLMTSSKDTSIVLSDPSTLQDVTDLVGRLRREFDYVVIDLPPFGGLVDASVIARLTDAMVLAVEWGRTPARRLARSLGANRSIRDRLVGAIFTKARLGPYQSYNGRASAEYYEF